MSLLDLFNQKYPSTDFHELNLDWCISAVLQLQKAFEDFSAGNKIVFADPLQHDLSKSYAKNTIVIDASGTAYLSLQPVPKGVQLDNTDYWLPVFDFAGYITRANQNFTDNYFSGTDRTPYALSVGDWVVLDDVLYKVAANMAADDLFIIGTNIVHFTVEQFLKDFTTSIVQTVNQYKADIDASELLYKQQLAQDIANTTASLQAQLDLAISGATVDSEVINARLGADGVTYPTLGDAIRTQISDLNDYCDTIENTIIDGAFRFNVHDFINGSISSAGNPSSDPIYKYRIRSKRLFCFDSDITLNCAVNFRIWMQKYSENNFSSAYSQGRTTVTPADTITISGGQWFGLSIEHYPEDTSDNLDAQTALTAVLIKSKLDLIDAAVNSISDDVDILKDNVDVIGNCIGGYFKPSDFMNGNISTAGTPSYDSTIYFYQIFSGIMQKFGNEITIDIDSGYKLTIKYYSSSTMISANLTGTETNVKTSKTIPSGQNFAIIIKRDPEDSTSPMDVTTALSHVRIRSVDTRLRSLENLDDIALPSYWDLYMKNIYPDLIAKDALIGNNGDSFVFITDIHVPRNSMISPQLIFGIYKNTAVKRLFNGGDLIDINAGADGKTTALAILQSWKKVVYGLNEIETRGNHDDNNYDGSNPDNEITADEWYGIMLKPLEVDFTLNKKTHYCIDNESQKMRYIILDCEGSDYTDNLNYLEDKLLELDSSWTALVIQHRYWNNMNTVSTIGTALQNKINSIYESLNCAFAGVLVGHLHADIDLYDSTYNYPIIGVCCDGHITGGSGYDRTVGTTNEHCFDVVHIDFTNKKLYLTRIGAGDTIVGGGTGVREYTY